MPVGNWISNRHQYLMVFPNTFRHQHQCKLKISVVFKTCLSHRFHCFCGVRFPSPKGTFSRLKCTKHGITKIRFSDSSRSNKYNCWNIWFNFYRFQEDRMFVVTWTKIPYIFLIYKLGCVVRMVVVSMLPHAECGPNDRRKDAPPFTIYQSVFGYGPRLLGLPASLTNTR